MKRLLLLLALLGWAMPAWATDTVWDRFTTTNWPATDWTGTPPHADDRACDANGFMRVLDVSEAEITSTGNALHMTQAAVGNEEFTWRASDGGAMAMIDSNAGSFVLGEFVLPTTWHRFLFGVGDTTDDATCEYLYVDFQEDGDIILENLTVAASAADMNLGGKLGRALPAGAGDTTEVGAFNICFYIRSDDGDTKDIEVWIQASWLGHALPYSARWLKVYQTTITMATQMSMKLFCFANGTNGIYVSQVRMGTGTFDPADTSPYRAVRTLLGGAAGSIANGYYHDDGTDWALVMDGTSEGHVDNHFHLYTSTDDGDTWTETTDDSNSIFYNDGSTYRYHDGSVWADGDTVICTANRQARDKSDVYVEVAQVSFDGGTTWTGDLTVSASDRNVFSRPPLRLANGNLLYVGTQDDDIGGDYYTRTLTVTPADANVANNWTVTDFASLTTALHEGAMAQLPTGELIAMWRTTEGFARKAYSPDNGAKWYNQRSAGGSQNATVLCDGLAGRPLVYNGQDPICLFWAWGRLILLTPDPHSILPRRFYYTVYESTDYGDTFTRVGNLLFADRGEAKYPVIQPVKNGIRGIVSFGGAIVEYLNFPQWRDRFVLTPRRRRRL